MSAIWETPEGLHLFASWLAAPTSLLLPPPATHVAAPHGMEGTKEGGSREEWWRAGLRVVEGIARGLKGVREREQGCRHRQWWEYSFKSKSSLPHWTDLTSVDSHILTHHILFNSCFFSYPFHFSLLHKPTSFLTLFLVNFSPQPVFFAFLQYPPWLYLYCFPSLTSTLNLFLSFLFSPPSISLWQDHVNLQWPLQVTLKVGQLHFLLPLGPHSTLYPCLVCLLQAALEKYTPVATFLLLHQFGFGLERRKKLNCRRHTLFT